MNDTHLDHCPTCGGDIDAHDLQVMVRNRNARDAQLRSFSEEMRRRDAEDDRWWNRVTFASYLVFAILVTIWIAWSSTQILQLKGVLD